MKNQAEYELQKLVCQWLNKTYPDVLFLSDTIASVKLTMPQAYRNKLIQKEGFKTPDLIILEPNKDFKGLFIELKIQSPFKKDMTLKKCSHLEAQQKTIEDLKLKGYEACFSWSLDQTVLIINKYMKNRL